MKGLNMCLFVQPVHRVSGVQTASIRVTVITERSVVHMTASVSVRLAGRVFTAHNVSIL